MGTPDDAAAMVAHLASEAGGFITGQRFTVNGGHVNRRGHHRADDRVGRQMIPSLGQELGRIRAET
jgi:NAD(P)-dependent dehydrogenase (short-subunit alcohol dehydrogenase family)